MPRWLRPACQARATLFTCAVVLNEEWVALCQIRTLDICARPATNVTTRRFELAWFWPYHFDIPALYCAGIGLNVVGGEREIEIAIALSQPLQHTLLRLLGRAHRYQFKVGITDDDDAVGGAPGGVNTLSADGQPEFLVENCCRQFEIMHANDDMVKRCQHYVILNATCVFLPVRARR